MSVDFCSVDSLSFESRPHLLRRYTLIVQVGFGTNLKPMRVARNGFE